MISQIEIDKNDDEERNDIRADNDGMLFTKRVGSMIKCLQCSVSHLVWAAPAFLDQDPHHLIMVVLGSKVDWKTTIMLRQEWVSSCL